MHQSICATSMDTLEDIRVWHEHAPKPVLRQPQVPAQSQPRQMPNTHHKVMIM